MGNFLAALLMKAGIALAEAIVTRLAWKLWTQYVRSPRAATAAA